MSEAPNEEQREKTTDEIWFDYYEKFSRSFDEWGGPDSAQEPIHLEVWSAIAQAIADISKCRIIVQSPAFKFTENERKSYVGYNTILIAEPDE